MNRRTGRLLPWLGLVASLILGGAALAQPDLYLTGAMSVSGVQDDNLFFSPGSRQHDTITRFTPEIVAGLRSERLSLASRLGVDAERFAEHPELDTTRARQFASIDVQSRASGRLTLSLRGDYLSTLSPGELNVTTGFAEGRLRATRRSVAPAADWRFGPHTVGTVSMGLTLDDLAGGVSAETRSAALGLEHRMSQRDTGTLRYDVSRYDFFEDVAPATAQTLSLGWDRRLGSATGLTIRAGPRAFQGQVDPEVALALHHDGRRLQASLAASRTLATVIGRAGTVVTDGVLPALSCRVTKALRLGVSPALFKIRDALGGPAVTVYLLGLDASWRIDDWLSLVGAYRRSLQRGALDAAVSGNGEVGTVARDTLLLSLVARPREPRPAAGPVPSGPTP